MPTHGSPIELFTRALLLADHALVDVRTRNLDTGAALSVRLGDLGWLDEYNNRKTINRLLECPPSLLDNVEVLCEALFTMRQGLPILVNTPLARRLILVIDPDVLVALHPELDLPESEPYDWPAIPVCDTGVLGDLLCRESVDTHIHLGGALPPVFFWVPLMGCELGPEALPFLAAEHRGHAEDHQWRREVIGSIWDRLWLAEKARQMSLGSQPPFEHIRTAAWKDLALTGKEPPDPDDYQVPLTREIPWKLIPEYLVRRGEGKAGSRQWPFADPLRSDPACHGRTHYAEGERRLLHRLGNILRCYRENPNFFKSDERAMLSTMESRLLRYLRIRNAFHQFWIHPKGSYGLLRFVENFGRRGFIFKTPGYQRRRRRYRRLVYKLEKCRMATALDAQLNDPFDDVFSDDRFPPRRRIEMRVSPPGGSMGLHVWKAWVDGIREHLTPSGWTSSSHRQDRSYRNNQCGLVIHFIKRPIISGWQQQQASFYLAGAERLMSMLKDYPNLRPLFVGLDAAGLERDTPPRVFGKTFRFMQSQATGHRARSGAPRIKLGYTYHVGEDTDDMLTGLRHVDEVACLLLPEEGGRLGHGLILGESPVDYYRTRGGYVETGIGPHILDLVWARGRLQEAGQNSFPWVDQRLLEQTGEKGLGPIAECFRAMGLKSTKGPVYTDEELLKNCFNLKNLGESISFPVEKDWLDLIGTVRKLLWKRLAGSRICVEVNPTSNLLVGGYSDYAALPYGALDEADLSFSLNSDDPGLFMTSLPGEFQAMYEVLIQNNSHRQTLRRLEDRLFDARHSSFLGTPVPLVPEGRLFWYDPDD